MYSMVAFQIRADTRFLGSKLLQDQGYLGEDPGNKDYIVLVMLSLRDHYSMVAYQKQHALDMFWWRYGESKKKIAKNFHPYHMFIKSHQKHVVSQRKPIQLVTTLSLIESTKVKSQV
jgi:hypothetical protein